MLAVEAAVERRHVLRLAAQHMRHREPVDIAVLQPSQRLGEDDVAAGAVAVEQENAGALSRASSDVTSDRIGVIPEPQASAA